MEAKEKEKLCPDSPGWLGIYGTLHGYSGSAKIAAAWAQHLRLQELFARVNAKLRGYYQYYGVNGNMASLRQFFQTSLWSLFKWLNRRSQRRSYTWQGYKDDGEEDVSLNPRRIP